MLSAGPNILFSVDWNGINRDVWIDTPGMKQTTGQNPSFMWLCKIVTAQIQKRVAIMALMKFSVDMFTEPLKLFDRVLWVGCWWIIPKWPLNFSAIISGICLDSRFRLWQAQYSLIMKSGARDPALWPPGNLHPKGANAGPIKGHEIYYDNGRNYIQLFISEDFPSPTKVSSIHSK